MCLKSRGSSSGEFQTKIHIQQIFIFIFFSITSFTAAQWTTQSPIPTHLDIRGIGAPTPQRIFIATDDNSFDYGGALFESTDGGSTWVQRNIPISLGSPLNGLFFLDNQNGWAYGNENYRTTDGGTNWTQLPLLGSTYFMKFYSAAFGLASGNFDRYVSYNGGDNWVPSPNNIFAFDFINEQTGLGVSNNGIFRTTDGGNTFTQVYTGVMKAVTFLSNNVAVSIADDVFMRSADGGLTWNPVTSSVGRTKLLKLSGDVVLAYGRTGPYPNYDDRILRSSDGGQTWNDLGEVIPDGVFAFSVIDEQTAVASDFSGNMFRSADAGLNWTQSYVSRGQYPGYLSSAFPVFADAQTGYFGYGNGFVIKTTDGGSSWFQISSGTGKSLNDIDRFPNGNMIAVGDNGTLLTSNGITPWIIHEAFTNINLTAVHVTGPDEVVVLDKEGRIYKSSDGGNSWIASNNKPSNLSTARDLSFTSLLDGWVIGSSFNTAALYHTTDGGDSWIPVTDFLGAYIAVDVEGSNIWAQNSGGRYYRSTNNGTTWIMEELPGSPHEIRAMDFYNESIGYAVGWWGEAFRSSDGGITWDLLPTPNNNHKLTGIYLSGANEIWLSTGDDVVYYSATGGLSWSILNIGSAGFGSFNSIVVSPDGEAWTVGYQGYIEYFPGPPPPPANQTPAASFNFNTIGLTANFTDTSFDPDGFIVSWEWNFGDGTGSAQQHPSHTFNTANTYIVTLTVTDNEGATGSAGRIVIVQPGPGGTFGDFTEVTPFDSIFVTPQDEDFWVIATAPGDFDSDGDLDIAVLGYYVVYNQSVEEKLLLLRNDGPSGQDQWGFTYIDVPLGDITVGRSDLAWGDADGDGDLDLVVGSNGKTVLYLNDAGVLVPTDTELPGYLEKNLYADFNLRSITWADYDNDGDLDLLLPSVYDQSTFSHRTALMRNDGPNGTGGWIFTEVDAGFAPTTHAQSSWADYDNDQDLDLLLVNIDPLTDDGFIRIYRNDGNGIFTGLDILGTLTVEHGEAQWGDYDGDGDLDILVAGNLKETSGSFIDRALRIYRNDDSIYTPIDVIDCISCEGWLDFTAATWADYNSDGKMDILLAGTYNSGSQIEGRARVYVNDGNGAFINSGSELPAPRGGGNRGGTFSWFDLDGDGDLDYFIAGQYFVPGGNALIEAQMHLYRNDVIDLNSAPLPPSGLTATIKQDKSVYFSWNPGSDDNTPAPALTYDIIVVRNGTHTPTKNGERSPLILPARLPEPGNISAATEWVIKGLPDGHYNWLLRTVDAAYVGSPVVFGEFSIGVTSAEDERDNTPNVYSIEQNYPNPFNPFTVIAYSIPKESFVSLKVYNAIGEEVIKLVNEIKDPGNYKIVFDATNFASGVYFYRLQAGNFSRVKKMIINK